MLALSLSVVAALLSSPQQLPAPQAAAVKEHYQQLGSAAVEAKPCDAIPPGIAVARVDASSRIRSASFGHPTTLVVEVPRGGGRPSRYWVEYGRSTNHPPALYGPFELP
jgi:hypothetical protein